MKTKYTCTTSVDDIRKYIGASKIIAFDYETAPDEKYRNESKAATDAHKAHLVGCSFSVAEGTGIYVPIAHKFGTNIDKDTFFHFLREFLSDTSITKIAHNFIFESQVSYALGIVIMPPVYDTMAASQLTLKNDTDFRILEDSGLKTLAVKLLGEPLPSFADVTDGRHFDELNANDYDTIRYGASDSDFALRLYNLFNAWFYKFLPKHRYITQEIESPTSVYRGIMKYNGIPLDYPLMLKHKYNAEAKMNELKNKISFIIGDVYIGANCSTKAFRDYLFNKLKLPVFKVTASNKTVADEMVLTLLKEWCDKNKPELSELFTLVLEYRKWGKIKSTYIDGYLKHINSATGKIHPKMFSLSTTTGRMSCQTPNAQNMPRKTNDPIGIRNFIKANENELILSLDFSQIELRIGAFYCRDKVMMETYKNGGDIHAATTSVIFGVSYEEAQDKHSPDYKEHRAIAKNVNFGTFYGLYPKGLQDTLKSKAGIEKTESECADIINNLKAGYKNLTAWQAETKADAIRRMYSETWCGRRRYLPKLRSDKRSERSGALRQALNTPIQGTAADILKLAAVRILLGLPERPWLKPILQIHDELVFVVPKDKLNEAVRFIKKCMEAQPFPEFDIPLVAEASAGETFGTMEELEEL